MARQKTVRLIQVLEDKGVFSKCSCREDILFYSDQGVRCSSCNKLYGAWYDSLRDSLQHHLSKRNPSFRLSILGHENITLGS